MSQKDFLSRFEGVNKLLFFLYVNIHGFLGFIAQLTHFLNGDGDCFFVVERLGLERVLWWWRRCEWQWYKVDGGEASSGNGIVVMVESI